MWGTTWHGTLESDEFRRAFLTEVAALAGRDFTVAPDTSFAAARQARLDTLADLVAGAPGHRCGEPAHRARGAAGAAGHTARGRTLRTDRRFPVPDRTLRGRQQP